MNTTAPPVWQWDVTERLSRQSLKKKEVWDTISAENKTKKANIYVGFGDIWFAVQLLMHEIGALITKKRWFLQNQHKQQSM